MITPTDLDIEMGKRVKVARESFAFSQEDLAKALKYANHSAIANIESGKQRMPIEKIYELCELFSIDIGFFLPTCEEKKTGKYKALVLPGTVTVRVGSKLIKVQPNTDLWDKLMQIEGVA